MRASLTRPLEKRVRPKLTQDSAVCGPTSGDGEGGVGEVEEEQDIGEKGDFWGELKAGFLRRSSNEDVD